MTKPAVWLFDSECVLCEWGVRYTLQRELEPSIKFVSIQSEAGKSLALENDIDPHDPVTFLFIEDGKVLTKSDGVLALVQHLKGPSRWLRIGQILPKKFRDFLYTIIARNRYAIFGKKDTCIVPEQSHKDRFVL